MTSLSNTQQVLADALDAFSQGDVLKAEGMLGLAAKEESARAEVKDTFSLCCMRATIAAMEGSRNVATLMEAASAMPQHASVTCYLEGLAAVARTNWQTARIKFEEAKRRDSTFVLANLGLAVVYFHAKNYRESFAAYREVLGLLGSRVAPPITRVGMGLCAYFLSRLDIAQQFLERALEVNPDDELALLGLLVVYLDRRLIPKVIETVVHLRRILPHNVMVLLRVGDLMYFKAIHQDRIKPSVKPIRMLLDEVRRCGTAEEMATADFQEGRLLLVAGDLAGAQSLLESALRTLPTLLAARVHYARLLFFLKKETEAVQLLLKIHKEHPQQKETLQLLAVYATQNGHQEAALQYCRRLTETVAEGDERSWSLACWCHRLLPKECVELMTHVISIQRDLGKTPSWQLLSNLAVLRQDFESLQSIVDVQLGGDFLNKPSLDVQYVPLLFNLALLLERHDRTRARQLYIFLVKKQSHARLAYYRLHTMAKEDGLPAQAIAWLTLLQQLIPGDPLSQAYIGHTFFEQQRYMASINVLRSTKSKSIPVALALGATYLWCCQQHGRDNRRFLANAKDRFLFVLRVDPCNILAAHGLACCLGLEEDYDHCQSMLHRVGEVVPNCAYVRQHYRAHMANVKTLSDSFKQAIDYLEKEQRRTPQQTSSLAFCLACEGRHDEAIAVLKPVVESGAGGPMLLYNLALLYNAAFISAVSKAEALSVTEGRRLRGMLEKGLSLASHFTHMKPNAQAMAIGQVFLKSVGMYSLMVYEGSLNRLIAIGQENEVEQRRESQQWAETFAVYRKEIQEEEQQRALLMTERQAEREASAREVLEHYNLRRIANPINIVTEAMASGDLEQYVDQPIEGMEVDAASNVNAILAGMQNDLVQPSAPSEAVNGDVMPQA